jgi:hypothetical protein
MQKPSIEQHMPRKLPIAEQAPPNCLSPGSWAGIAWRSRVASAKSRFD